MGGDVAFGPLFGRSEARADRADVQNQGANALMERHARIAYLLGQVREIQQQNNLPGPLSRTPTVSAEANQGVIPDGLGLTSKAPPLRRQDGNSEAVRAKYHGAPEPSPMYRDLGPRLSPAYSEPDKGIWDQSYLSKALQQMKDSEMTKLKLPPSCYKPLEYEKWIMSVSTAMKGLHPEIGHCWQRVCNSAEQTYESYSKDLSYTRVSILPAEVLARTPIEERIESRLKMILANLVPQSIIRHCDDREDVS